LAFEDGKVALLTALLAIFLSYTAVLVFDITAAHIKAIISSSSLPGTCWAWVLMPEGVCLLGTVPVIA